MLRLSGILDSLEAHNRQAIEGKLAYTAFLAMLIGDEVARRENTKFSPRLRRAQLRTTKTLEQFDFDRLPKLNRALVHDLATARYLHEKADEDLHDLIAERHEQAATIVTSNLEFEE